MSGNPEYLKALAQSQRRTPEQFLDDTRKVHGDKYEYPDLRDVRAKSRIRIVCLKHGEFEQTVNNHINGNGCPKCAIEARPKTFEFKPRMKRRIDNSIWINRLKTAHGDKYEYPDLSDPLYSISTRVPIRVVCSIHGESLQFIENHLRGIGCSKCAVNYTASVKPTNTRTSADFIRIAKEAHGDKYEYPDLSDVRNDTVIPIICPVHGEIKQKVENHLNGNGCWMCASISNGRSTMADFDTLEKMIRDSHGERYSLYTYPNLVGVPTKERIEVVCSRHGKFDITLGSFLQGRGCVKCAYGIEPIFEPHDKVKAKVGRFTESYFLEKAKRIHGDRYEYDTTGLVSSSSIISIKCKVHGWFKQEAGTHIYQSSGCKRCKASKGERIIGAYLESRGIEYAFQYKVESLVGIGGRSLAFDFFIPSKNVAIEYDGEHHDKPTSFGAHDNNLVMTRYTRQLENDKRKNDWCVVNGVNLIRFQNGSTQSDIKEVLDNAI